MAVEKSVDAHKVGHNETVKAPLFLQDLAQKLRVAGRRHSVDGIV